MRLSILMILLAASGAWLASPEQDNGVRAAVPVEKPVAQFMRQKLKHSNDVLEGLVVEDYEQLKQAADGLKTMSLAADWQVVRSPTYDRFSREFRSATDQLANAAKKKNIDGAALAHVRMVMTCIRCHQHIRGAEVTTRPPQEQLQSDSSSKL